eukprot:sb/3475798/
MISLTSPSNLLCPAVKCARERKTINSNYITVGDRERELYIELCASDKNHIRNRPILVPDWLITSHVTLITSFDWLFTCFGRFLIHIESCYFRNPRSASRVPASGSREFLKYRVAQSDKYKVVI